MINRLERCPSTYLGVPCRKAKGHDDRHSGLERGAMERWRWTDDGKLDVFPVFDRKEA